MNGRFRIGERIISSRYEVREEVGAGGFGVVLRCLDTRLGREVAIKISLDSHPEAVPRFLREAKTIAKLEHANIARIYDSGEEGGRPYIVQEFLGGTDLSEVVRKNEMALSDKLNVLIQIAKGLAAAHSCSIVHRDVSPRNVRILPDGTIKIVDFGLAKFVDNTQGVTTRGYGTPGYYPPEVNSVGKTELSFDVFSYGVIAYELLTGRRIFGGDQESYRMFVGGEVPLPPLWEEIPSAPAKLVAVIEKCLRIRKKERFPNAMVLLEWLEGLPAQILPYATRTTASGRVPTPRGRMVKVGESAPRPIGSRVLGAPTSKAMLIKRVKKSSVTKVQGSAPSAGPLGLVVTPSRYYVRWSRITWIAALAGFGIASVLAGYSIAPRFAESSIGSDHTSLIVRAAEKIKKLSLNAIDADQGRNLSGSGDDLGGLVAELKADLRAAGLARDESESRLASALTELREERENCEKNGLKSVEDRKAIEELLAAEVQRNRSVQGDLEESQKKVATLVHQAVVLEKDVKAARSQWRKVEGELDVCKLMKSLRGQVIDPATSLHWSFLDNEADITWLDARKYCAELGLGGVTGWRLPTMAELAEISSRKFFVPCGSGTCKLELPIKLSAPKVWSDSVLAADRVEVFDFDRLVMSDHNPEHALGVRALCVRSN